MSVTRNSRRWHGMGGLTLWGIMLASCASPYEGQNRNGAIPPDFTLTLHVAGADRPEQPLTLTSQYVVEPNRHLRVALGSGVTSRYYPSLTRILSTSEFETLVRLVQEHQLQKQSTSPSAEQTRLGPNPTAVLYSVWIMAHGRSHHYQATPEESPATERLLSYLVKLRQPVLPTPTP